MQGSFLKGPALETSKMQRTELTPRQAETESLGAVQFLSPPVCRGAGCHATTMAILRYLV